MIENFILHLSTAHRLTTYGIIFGGMFIEGEIILLLSGVLIKAGAIRFFYTLIITFIAVALHDIAYWYIGKKLFQFHQTKFLWFKIDKFLPLLHKIKKREGFYVFVSKFIWNTNRFVLISLGYLNTPLEKFLKYSLAAAFFWPLTLISLGFMFAEQTELLRQNLKIATVSVIIFVAAIMILGEISRRFFRTLINNHADTGA